VLWACYGYLEQVAVFGPKFAHALYPTLKHRLRACMCVFVQCMAGQIVCNRFSTARRVRRINKVDRLRFRSDVSKRVEEQREGSRGT
jgi:hypothetical protein